MQSQILGEERRKEGRGWREKEGGRRKDGGGRREEGSRYAMAEDERGKKEEEMRKRGRGVQRSGGGGKGYNKQTQELVQVISWRNFGTIGSEVTTHRYNMYVQIQNGHYKMI